MTAIASAFCRHEGERCQLPPRTLHERMILEAEPIIRHNWSDVAIHDKQKLQSIPIGHYCAWIVGEMGSYLTPLYCRISDRPRWKVDPLAHLAPIQILVSRWHSQVNSYGENVHWLDNHDPTKDKHCYLIVKTDTTRGTITPIPYVDLAGLAVCGLLPITRKRSC